MNFLIKRFGQKYKHTKLALNFVQKHNLVKETCCPFILVECQHHDPAKVCF